MRKLSMGLIVVLFLAIVAEVLFLFGVFSPKNPTENLSANQQEPVSRPTDNPHRTDEVAHTTYSAAIREDQIDWLRRSRDTGHIRSTLRQEFSGSIFKIQRMKYETEIGQLTGTNIVLTADSVTDEYKMNIFAITDNQLNVVSVTDDSKDGSKPITISDLQEGDQVEITTELDLSKNFGESLILVRIKKI